MDQPPLPAGLAGPPGRAVSGWAERGNRLPHALAHADPGIRVDIVTRLQGSDPHAANPVQFLDGNPRVRLRLPCGTTDWYIPKEFLYLYGEPILTHSPEGDNI